MKMFTLSKAFAAYNLFQSHMRHEFAPEAKMSVFPDAGPRQLSHSAGGVHNRVSRGLSVLIIGGLSALSWGVLVGIVMALRAAL